LQILNYASLTPGQILFNQIFVLNTCKIALSDSKNDPEGYLLALLKGARSEKDSVGMDAHPELKEGLGMFIDKFLLHSVPDYIDENEKESVLALAQFSRDFLLR
jgi:hypothetical protein